MKFTCNFEIKIAWPSNCLKGFGGETICCVRQVAEAIHFRSPLFTPGAVWSTYMMEGCTFHSHYKAWKSQDIF